MIAAMDGLKGGSMAEEPQDEKKGKGLIEWLKSLFAG